MFFQTKYEECRKGIYYFQERDILFQRAICSCNRDIRVLYIMPYTSHICSHKLFLSGSPVFGFSLRIADMVIGAGNELVFKNDIANQIRYLRKSIK